jgi:hypothetical protein
MPQSILVLNPSRNNLGHRPLVVRGMPLRHVSRILSPDLCVF